jgi:hypothetical protein
MDASHFSPEAQQLIRLIQSSREHVFLTGKAGTGKSTLVKYIIDNQLKSCLVTAPTGIAALNVGGTTLHALFQLPLGGYLPVDDFHAVVHACTKFETSKSLVRELRMSQAKRMAIQQAELLIIDEVSMLRADLLDAIDRILRSVRKHNQAFGGLQLLLVGDMMQLPPVIKREEWELLSDHYPTPYFFEAHAFKQKAPRYIRLNKVYRQSDENYLALLNRIRFNKLTEADFDWLDSRFHPQFKAADGQAWITLCTHNWQTEKINNASLQALNKPIQPFEATIKGEFPEHMYPCESQLQLAVGAQVMFVRNDLEQGGLYYNGKLAEITDLMPDSVSVRFEDGGKMTVTKVKWENIRYTTSETDLSIKSENIGTFEQYPLRLAWAITIHKSQGLSFDRAVLDMQQAFSSGQAYVAMSRIRRAEGVVLSSKFPRKPIAYQERLQLFEQAERKALSEAELSHISKLYAQELAQQCFNFRTLIQAFQYHLSSYNKDGGKSKKQQYQSWAEGLLEQANPLETYGSGARAELQKASTNPSSSLKYIQTAVSQTEPVLRAISCQIILQMNELGNQKGVKSYHNELADLDSLVMNHWKKLVRLPVLYEGLYSGHLEVPKGENLPIEWRTTLLQQLQMLQQQAKGEHNEQNDHAGKNKSERKNTQRPKKGGSMLHTLELYEGGLTVDEIAQNRNLAASTIYGHLATAIEQGLLAYHKLLDPKQYAHIVQSLPDIASLNYSEMVERVGDKFEVTTLLLCRAARKHELTIKATA